MKRFAVAVAALALAFSVTESDAHALGPVDIEAGAKVGIATNPNSDGVNPFGFGVGGRAGVSIFNLYGGLSAIHYFGGDTDVPPVGKISYTSTLLGVEVGYGIKPIPLLTIRPQIGVGNAAFSAGDTTNSHVYVEPGVTGLVSLGILYVGADANLLLIPGVDQGTEKKTYTSLSLHGQIGVQF